MATRMIGKIDSFDVSAGNWRSYCERLDMFITVNDIKPEMRLPVLISAVGDAAYELMADLCSPKKPAQCSYEEVVRLMERHLQPRPSVVAERYAFRQCRQAAGQPIADYVARLKKMSRHCDFGTTLNENLRDQLVCGLCSELIRQRLFAEEALDWSKCVLLATTMEAAERNAAAVDAAGAAAQAERPTTTAEAHYTQPVRGRLCSACGGTHQSNDCRFRRYECSHCKRKGHLRRVCPEKTRHSGGGAAAAAERPRGAGPAAAGNGHNVWRGAAGQQPGRSGGGGGRSGARAHWLQDGEEAYSDIEAEDEDDTPVYQMSLNKYRPVSIPINIQGRVLNMEIDTGSALSCISRSTYDTCFNDLQIKESNITLRFYDGTKIKPLGYAEVAVTFEGKTKILDLYVIDKGTTCLLGRQWLTELCIPIPMLSVNNIKADLDINKNIALKNLLSNFSELFDGGLGRYTGGKAVLQVRPGAAPVFCRARPLPYALRSRVDAELDAMLRDGIIAPVDSSDWATPLVIVKKADGGLRICSDFKVSLNPVLVVDKYPLPKIEDLLSQLNGSQFFTKLDLSQAYQQVELENESKKYTVINTHRGLFIQNRLVYGVASAPSQFQRIMTELFRDIPGVVVFLDDILITGSTLTDHLITLEKVLKRLQEKGLKIKKSKCVFLAAEVKYLGYVISRDGIKADEDKIKPILNMAAPTNQSELRSFLGMVIFYSKFIKNLSTLLTPLNLLLKKGREWRWDREQSRSFAVIKRLLTKTPVLGHYDLDLPVTVTCDASGRGIGAVLAQTDERGRERVIAYASRTLTPAEHNYSQIHREALAIVFAVKKFHQYLYGRTFHLRTDHKPLLSIFGPGKGVPSMTASRLQRWAVILSAYDFTVEYVRTDANVADALSRLIGAHREASNQEVKGDEAGPEQTYLHFATDAVLLDSEQLRKETAKDSLFSKVMGYIRHGWPATADDTNVKPLFNRRAELYCELGCLMWGHRVVIPASCRMKVLKELHDSHMGIVRTKQIARSYVWWPGIDEAIEATCKHCAVCNAVADAPRAQAPRVWPWPDRPWTRLHIDFLGPIAGTTYLVCVDSCTKWIEIERMNGTTAKSVIKKLREMWARFGLPKQLVSDNGPPFTSSEFEEFLKNNGVEHILTAPYHPASNGAAENAVKTCKKIIKKALQQGIDIETALTRFLLIYRNTEHPTTGESPASLLQGRALRTRLECLKPDREARVRRAQRRQEHDAGGAERAFQVGATVWARQHRGPAAWREGRVTERLGSSDYVIQSSDGQRIHRHVDQIRPRLGSPELWDSGEVQGPRVHRTCGPVCLPAEAGDQSELSPASRAGAGAVPVIAGRAALSPGGRRYPERDRRSPVRYGFEE